jgi:hypothetical protein
VAVDRRRSFVGLVSRVPGRLVSAVTTLALVAGLVAVIQVFHQYTVEFPNVRK